MPIDGLRGLYTAWFYPALSMNDAPQPAPGKQPTGDDYPKIDPPPNHNAWAFWSGTSFSTPIITGLAARILQTQAVPSIDVRQEILNLAHGQVIPWSPFSPRPMISVKQCEL
jgi:hypothetical protein